MAGPPQYIRPLQIRHVDNEEPAGSVNGINATFNTSFDFIPESVKLYLNGMRLRQGLSYDYTVSGCNTIDMNFPPESGDFLIVDYLRT